MNLAVVVLAAGKGTRMKSDLPKCMHQVAHRPIVLLGVDEVRELEPEKILCVVGPDQPSLKQAVESEGMITVIQENRLGTAHAVLQAYEELKDFNGIILVTYGDTPLVSAESLRELTESLARDSEAITSIMGFYTNNPNEYGRLIHNEHGEFVGIVEAKDAAPDELSINYVNSGLMALKSPACWDILKGIDNDNAAGEYYLTEAITLANIHGYKSIAIEGMEDELRGVNTREGLAHVEFLEQQRLRRKHMLGGVTMLAPETVYLSFDTKIEPDVIIEPNVYFGPQVHIGSGCHIKAFSHIEKTTIGENCNIGPFARLRPETEVSNNVNIGNFVEVKKSTIGQGSKVNHLSYIGDSTIGMRTNIGAGTITCNYNGYFKYQTQIGDDVFVGSHSLFIPPLSVGNGATIGAGSVITEDVKADSLALTRAERKDKEGWSLAFRQRMQAQKDEAAKDKNTLLLET